MPKRRPIGPPKRLKVKKLPSKTKMSSALKAAALRDILMVKIGEASIGGTAKVKTGHATIGGKAGTKVGRSKEAIVVQRAGQASIGGKAGMKTRVGSSKKAAAQMMTVRVVLVAATQSPVAVAILQEEHAEM